MTRGVYFLLEVYVLSNKKGEPITGPPFVYVVYAFKEYNDAEVYAESSRSAKAYKSKSYSLIKLLEITIF